MKTLHMRIVVTFAVALLCSFVVLGWVSFKVSQYTYLAYFENTFRLELLQAEEAYQAGGPQALAKYLDQVDSAVDGKRYFTNASGRDLVSGEDLSSMKPTLTHFFLFLPIPPSSNPVLIRNSANGRYRLIVVAPNLPKAVARIQLLLLLIPLGIVLLGGTLSTGIVFPLRTVSNAVDRFGKGDLSARLDCKRNDEIGKLARSFNNMADRIETLLTAERRLLQDVSHELRSPLVRLGFAVELMKHAPDQESAALRVRYEMNRLSFLVGELLEVTSAEGDPASRKTRRVPIGPLVESIVLDSEIEAEARSVQVEAHIDSLAAVEGDPELLRRSIENVLRNALRFAPESSKVLLDVVNRADRIMITIRDSGPGVPDDLLVRIFDPLFRVDESRDHGTGGMGLGLSIARRAVLLHRGEIVAENALPGLRVTIDLPAISG